MPMELYTRDRVAKEQLAQFKHTGKRAAWMSHTWDAWARKGDGTGQRPEWMLEVKRMYDIAPSIPDTATYEDLVRLGWPPTRVVMPTCDNCNADDSRPVVRLGEEPDYDSRTAYVCQECLTTALAMLPKEPTR